MKNLVLSIMLLATLILVSCSGSKKVEVSKNSETKFSSEASKLCFTKATVVVSKDDHFFIIAKGSSADLGDDKMSISMSKDDSRRKLSFFNGDFLKKFALFILKNKGKNIAEKTEDISKNETKGEVSKNTKIIEMLSKSKFADKDMNFFDVKVIKSDYISCMMYDIESSVYDKLKGSKDEMSKEDIHNNFVEFLKESEYKSIEIK